MIQSQWTTFGFMSRFDQVYPTCKNQKIAYELVEQEHEDLHGSRKFSSYQSFRVVRYGRIKRILKRK